MTTDTSGTGRTWGGTTLSDRRAARREKLLEAGLDLLGGDPPAAVAVRAVCRHARLTERYFYESFTDRDALVVAVFDQVAAETSAVLQHATRDHRTGEERARAAVESTVGLMLDDPRKGRVLLLAPLTERVLSSRGLELSRMLALMIREQLSPEASDQDRELIAVGLLGALTTLFSSYLQGALTASREEFVAHCVRLLLTVDRLHG